MLNSRQCKSHSSKNWTEYNKYQKKIFSLQKILQINVEKVREVKSEQKQCKKCMYADYIVHGILFMEADWDGPAPECSSNNFSRKFVIKKKCVIIRSSYSTWDGCWGCEFEKISLDDFIYCIAHHPTTFVVGEKTHKSISFNAVKELVYEQYSDDYHYGDNDGFDYSKEKSPTIIMLESMRENFQIVSILKNLLNFDCTTIVFLYLEYEEDFERLNIQKMKIGDSIQY